MTVTVKDMTLAPAEAGVTAKGLMFTDGERGVTLTDLPLTLKDLPLTEGGTTFTVKDNDFTLTELDLFNELCSKNSSPCVFSLKCGRHYLET
jgi:hypothetical protein